MNELTKALQQLCKGEAESRRPPSEDDNQLRYQIIHTLQGEGITAEVNTLILGGNTVTAVHLHIHYTYGDIVNETYTLKLVTEQGKQF